jgi:hypothetical protein
MKLDKIGKGLMCVSAAGLLALPAIATADHHNTMEITVEAALDVDILLAIDLPLVAHEARESGIDEQEIDVALTSAMSGGLSAGAATEIVAVEVEETRKRGAPQDNFGQWVRRQVAAGVTGQELAQSIRERKAELDELSEQEEEELDGKLEEVRERHKTYRAALREKREELRADGKAVALRGKSEHDARKRALVAARADLLRLGKSMRAGGPGVARGKPHVGRPQLDAPRGDGDDVTARADDVKADAAKRDAKANEVKADAAKGDAKGKGPNVKASAADAKADAGKAKADAAKAKAGAAKAAGDAKSGNKADAAKAKADNKSDAKAR